MALPECEIRYPEDPLISALAANGNKLVPALEQVAAITRDKGQVTAINVTHRRFSDEAIKRIRGLRQVQRLSLKGTKVSDELPVPHHSGYATDPEPVAH